MAEISIQLDETTLKALEARAARRHLTVAGWIKERINAEIKKEWPENYFSVFGSLSDCDLEEPAEIPPNYDAKRESL